MASGERGAADHPAVRKSGNRRCPACGITMAYLGTYSTRHDQFPNEPPGPDAAPAELRDHIEAMRSERNWLRSQLFEAASALQVFIRADGMATYLGLVDPQPVAAPAPTSDGVHLFSLPDVGV